jgi:hypothetical protein
MVSLGPRTTEDVYRSHMTRHLARHWQSPAVQNWWLSDTALFLCSGHAKVIRGHHHDGIAP